MSEKKDIFWRAYLIYFGFVILMLVVLFKTVSIQFEDGRPVFLTSTDGKEKMPTRTVKRTPRRGQILDVNYLPLVTSVSYFDIHMDPTVVKDEIFDKEVSLLSVELAKMYQHILNKKRVNYNVVFGMDGYDELTLTNSTRLLGKYDDKILSADSFKTMALDPNDILAGSSVKSAALIISQILSGKGSPAQNQVIAANVATALSLFDSEIELSELFTESMAFIQSGQGSKHYKFN